MYCPVIAVNLILFTTSYLVNHLCMWVQVLLPTLTFKDSRHLPMVWGWDFISSNIPVSPAYVVYISQFMRYSMTCTHYIGFLGRAQLLTQKLLKQDSYVEVINTIILRSSTQSGRPLLNIPQMTMDPFLFT